MSYLIPVSNLDTRKDERLLEYKKSDFEDILTQQIVISQMANGITYSDTENMDMYERIFILKKLIAMKKEEIEAKKEAMKNIGK